MARARGRAPVDAARALLGSGPRVVLLTRGGDGASSSRADARRSTVAGAAGRGRRHDRRRRRVRRRLPGLVARARPGPRRRSADLDAVVEATRFAVPRGRADRRARRRLAAAGAPSCSATRLARRRSSVRPAGQRLPPWHRPLGPMTDLMSSTTQAIANRPASSCCRAARAHGRGHARSAVVASLPRGRMLPVHLARRRHRAIAAVLWASVPGLLALRAPARLRARPHAARHAPGLALAALAASRSRLSPRWQMVAASLGLVTCSAMLVHLWGGTIEAHFHFFVVIGLLTLYQDWLPFLAGDRLRRRAPRRHRGRSTSHPSTTTPAAEPTRGAGRCIHGAFVLAASVDPHGVVARPTSSSCCTTR